MYPIDFVIPWVDGSDPKWLSEKRKYRSLEDGSSTLSDANGDYRYRDNGFLKYWFRGVETFAPWVNHVFFITCNQHPEWLNTKHPKLVCINHKDYIPDFFLPTFNANTIEMNLHRIQGLSEHFVYFNDDMFLVKPISEDFFFREGNPVLDTKIIYPPSDSTHNFERLLFNDFQLLNASFNPISSILSNKDKWFNISALGLKRGLTNLFRFIVGRKLPVSTYGHLAFPHLKSSFKEVWEHHPFLLKESSSYKFRSDSQVNQWLLCAWNQAKGTFYPTHRNRIGSYFIFNDDNLEAIKEFFELLPTPLLCLNETELGIVSDSTTSYVSKEFDTLLPIKSSFEL